MRSGPATKHMKAFDYPEVSTVRGSTAASPAPAVNAPPEISNDDLAGKLAQVHTQGLLEGERRALEQHAKALFEEKSHIAEALKRFAADTAEYYSRVEVEVVKLALGIASKILHREAQVDPLLVAGLVRVALDKFYKNTKAVVRVRPEDASGWRQYFAQHMEQSSIPEVIDDSSIQPHDCLLETDLGSTELGLATQLKEIENGLFDLLAQRPEPK